ncbi:MAG: hypothetical protein HZC05_00800 [Candidatus Magasanikbacteria bacterium]|nr:hypothetical protein [Candidatus Magasanikbacteria bacterium]
MPINQKHFKILHATFREWEKGRREVQEHSTNALQAAKQAIFSFHRNDWKEGGELLSKSLAALKKAAKAQEKSIASSDEGVFNAALEEYAEADLFQQFLFNKSIGPITGIEVAPETYLGGLSDTIGEILRYAMKQATERNFSELKRATEAVEEIMGTLIQFNFTGYLRTKFDQAKNARRKMEEIAYEVSLKSGK